MHQGASSVAQVDEWAARMAASSERVAELDEALSAERERRDDLVTEGFDLGVKWRKLALTARCSVTLCRKIVAGGSG
jgi:hypothetical protein